MKILALQAENIKRLTAVEIRPDGALVQITGANGQGKTSVLDSIWWALSGVRNIQVAPIRNGATKAYIRLDLGDLIVTRKFALKDDQTFTTTITVENADGARFGSPQQVLDKLVGALSFDPLEFTRLPAKDQIEALKSLVPGVDWAKIETANKADFDKRTEVNRRAKELKTRADAIEAPADALDPVDVDGLIAKIDEAGQRNAAIERERAQRTVSEKDIADTIEGIHRRKSEIARLQATIESLQQSNAEDWQRVHGLQAKAASLPPLPEPIDTADLRRQIQEAKATNDSVAKIQEKKRLASEALKAEVEAGSLTKTMRDRAEDVAAAIAGANLPVPGLGFGDGYVVLNGQPFAQASGAEQLRTSIALAMAMNPQLKVLRIKDGSLLDESGLRMVAEMAEAEGFQVWLERVDTSGRVGFVIEDGAVRDALPIAAE